MISSVSIWLFFDLQYMMLIIIAATLIFIIGTQAKEVTFGHHFGFFSFDPGISKQETYLSHLQAPLVLYSLASVQTPSLFSYWSLCQTIQGVPEDKLIISVEIKGVLSYKITIQYFILEQMPNIEVGLINLTWSKPQKLFKSYKGLIFGTATQLTAHLIGFSSSNFTYQNFFFAMKGTNTYNVYTKVNLTNHQWVAINFIVMEPSYHKDEITCHGSHIYSAAEVKPGKQLINIEKISHNLPFFLGVQAIYSQKCNFMLQGQSKINITSGSYSYSIIFLNTSCIVQSKNPPKFTKNALVYLILMIVFVVFSSTLIVIWVLYCIFLIKQYRKEMQNIVQINNDERVEIELQQRIENLSIQQLGQQEGEQEDEQDQQEGEQEEYQYQYQDQEEAQNCSDQLKTQVIIEYT